MPPWRGVALLSSIKIIDDEKEKKENHGEKITMRI